MIEDSWPVPLRDAGAPSTTRYLNRLPEMDGRPRRRHGKRSRPGMLTSVDSIDEHRTNEPRAEAPHIDEPRIDKPGTDKPAVAPGRRVAETMRSAVSAPSVDRALDQVVTAAMETGRWCACGMSVLESDGTLRSVSRTSPPARRLDELQYLIGEGPLLDVVSAEPVLEIVSTDLHRENRWPGWTTVAAGTGIRSVLTLRLFTDVTVGALSLYSRFRTGPDEATLAAAQVAAAQASVVLVYAQCEWRLWNAIDVQTAIGRAQGILMQRYGIAADAATAVLRTYSAEHELTVPEVARRIADNGASFDPSSWALFHSRRTPKEGR
ncbi:GAF and ANTAR domain-containing protein [Nakamurella sp. GG22]